MSTTTTPPLQLELTDEEQELLLSCRYGDLEDVQQYIALSGAETLSKIRDGNGNCVLHMVCGNGHTELLELLLPLVEPTLLSTQNTAKSTPLHWAAVNSHLDAVKKLVEFPGGPGAELIDIKNAAGLSPIGEAEMAGWDEGAQWLVGMMKLDPHNQKAEGSAVADDGEGEDDEVVVVDGQDIEVEIEDADGKIAKMTIAGTVPPKTQ